MDQPLTHVSAATLELMSNLTATRPQPAELHHAAAAQTSGMSSCSSDASKPTLSALPQVPIKLPQVMSANEANRFRRQRATAREHKRASSIRSAFTALVDHLPNTGKRLSRLDALLSATTYIQELSKVLDEPSEELSGRDKQCMNMRKDDVRSADFSTQDRSPESVQSADSGIGLSSRSQQDLQGALRGIHLPENSSTPLALALNHLDLDQFLSDEFLSDTSSSLSSPCSNNSPMHSLYSSAGQLWSI